MEWKRGMVACFHAYPACYTARFIRVLDQCNDTERVVHAFISSKLDYCNGLFYGLPSSEIQKLQRQQNAAARLITRTQKFDHITPVLINLHWLPIEHRVIFKLLSSLYL